MQDREIEPPLLMIPGPTPIPFNVLDSLSSYPIPHRSIEFCTIIKECNEGLKKIFATQNDVFIYASSGTGAMCAALENLINLSDKILCLVMGNFGARFEKIARSRGANVDVLRVGYGEIIEPQELEAMMRQKNYKLVTLTHSETSSGAANDIKTLCAIIKKYGALSVVDGITSLCAMECKMDEWEIDVLISAMEYTPSAFSGKTQKLEFLARLLPFIEPRLNLIELAPKGTGKSSTVKAVVNEYAERGLKIIEMSPRHITCFPKIFAETLRSPFRFIVFLDDLTFSREDDNFAALKAFIEGGLAGKPANLVIYATSNRRHLIRESFADREGDEVRVRDSLETVTSLSDRFGLEITFSVPDRDEYLYIVDQLAAESGVDLPGEQLHLLAERFALRRNGRSPRTARQFISQQLAEKYDRKL